MKKIANIFKALSDDTRLRVIKLLQERELCVCELMQVLDMSQPRISRHMSVLKNAGLVEDRREGKWVFYSLKGDKRDHNVTLILKTIPFLGHDSSIYKEDRNRLKSAVKLSDLGKVCGKRTNQPVKETVI